MGYTHHWNNRSKDRDAYREGLKAVRSIVGNSPVPLANGYGDRGTEPEVSPRIFFNGVGPDDDHETFHLPAEPTQGFEFCKTAYKPYDLIVVACLAAMQEIVGKDFAVSSDGESADWMEGCKFASEILGRRIPVPTLEDGCVD